MRDLKHRSFFEDLRRKDENDLVKQAKSVGLKQAIEHVLKRKVIERKTDLQLMGALGAAEFAREKAMAKA